MSMGLSYTNKKIYSIIRRIDAYSVMIYIREELVDFTICINTDESQKYDGEWEKQVKRVWLSDSIFIYSNTGKIM